MGPEWQASAKPQPRLMTGIRRLEVIPPPELQTENRDLVQLEKGQGQASCVTPPPLLLVKVRVANEIRECPGVSFLLP